MKEESSFSEEKEAKRLCYFDAAQGIKRVAIQKRVEVFCFFFSKKKGFLAVFPVRARGGPCPANFVRWDQLNTSHLPDAVSQQKHAWAYRWNDGLRGTRMFKFISSSLVAAGVVLCATQANAVKYTIQQISYPGSVATYATAINDAGAVGGTYTDAAGGSHGFILSNGTYTSFDGPGGPQTDQVHVVAISADGTLAGWLDDTTANTNAPFIRTPAGSVVVVAVPGSGVINAINDKDIACGSYVDQTGRSTAFVYDTAPEYFAPPNANDTYCAGINNAGYIVGTYTVQGSFNRVNYLLHFATGQYIEGYGPDSDNCNAASILGIDSQANIYGLCDDAEGDINPYRYSLTGDTALLIPRNGYEIISLNAVNKYGRVVSSWYDAKNGYPAMFSQKVPGISQELIITDQPANAYGSNKAGVLVGYAADSSTTAFSFTATPQQ